MPISNSFMDEPSDIELLWKKDRPHYLRRQAGDGWETAEEFWMRINRSSAPIGYKAVSSRLREMFRAGKLMQGYTLVDGRVKVCYKAMDKATLLIADASGNVKKVRSKRKRKPRIKATDNKKPVIKGKAAKP